MVVRELTLCRVPRIITALGAKVSVMKLMTHPDEEVKKQALLCIQKLMVVNWEYLAK